jgi:transposase
MGVETRSQKRFRSAMDTTYPMVDRYVDNILGRTCPHCDDEYDAIMDVYEAVIESRGFKELYRALPMAELYAVWKSAELVGNRRMCDNVRLRTGEHVCASMKLADYDRHWREICEELDYVFIHSRAPPA